MNLTANDDLRQRFIREFLGDKLTARQKNRLATVMALLREAYLNPSQASVPQLFAAAV